MTKNTIFGCGKWAVIGKPLQTEFLGCHEPRWVHGFLRFWGGDWEYWCERKNGKIVKFLL
jgi:hypothetical protein